MKSIRTKTRRIKALVISAVLAIGSGSAMADGTDPIAAAQSTLSGLSTPTQAAAVVVIGVFGIFCLVKLGKKLLSSL